MADPLISGTDELAAPAAGHVLHVADRDVCLRFGPMLAQVWQDLCAAGWRGTLLTDDQEMLARLAGTPVQGHRVPHLGGWRAWDLDAYLQAHLRPPPDLVHSWGTTGLWWLQRWSRRDHVPLLVHALGAAHVARLMRARPRDDQYLAVAAQPLAAPLLTRFPMAASRCQIVPPAIAPPIRATAVRPAERSFSVLCVGPLAEHRGLEVLVDATAELHRKGCDLHVALVGAGPGVSAVWRRIHTQQVRGCVLLVDEPRLWEQVLPEVDACVVPGAQPELTIVPLLAMALGKLVIASRDQPAEWFIEDHTAWQFTPGSAVELAYLLARAIEQPQRAQDVGRSAGEYVRAHHSVHDLVARLAGLYGRLCPPRATSLALRENERGERGTE